MKSVCVGGGGSRGTLVISKRPFQCESMSCSKEGGPTSMLEVGG